MVQRSLLLLCVNGLQTNNPRKISELEALGLHVSGRIPCIVNAPNQHSWEYMQAKELRMDHLLDGRFQGDQHLGTLPRPRPGPSSGSSVAELGAPIDKAMVPVGGSAVASVWHGSNGKPGVQSASGGSSRAASRRTASGGNGRHG